MTCIALDTNTIISGLFWKGPPRRVLELAMTGAISAHINTSIVLEISRVLQSKKFNLSPDEARMILSGLSEIVIIADGESRVEVIEADPSDNRVLECAVEADADFIVSGDKHLLEMKIFKGIRILKAREFLEILED